jgi:hypothetical protein
MSGKKYVGFQYLMAMANIFWDHLHMIKLMSDFIQPRKRVKRLSMKSIGMEIYCVGSNSVTKTFSNA